MPELETFDARLEAAVHAFADRAQTNVDAAATAERAMRSRPRGRLAWLGIAVPVPVSILVVLALLVLALAMSLGIGAPRRGQDAALPAVVVSPAVASPGAASPTAATPDPGTDGQGAEVVVGTAILAPTTPYVESREGATTRLRDGVITVTTRMSDPRVSGTGTWRVNADLYSTTGPRWGAYRLENTAGAWDGICSGAAWDTGSGGAWSCRLTGSGAFDGYSYLFSATTSESGGDDVRGVIVPGPLPSP